LLSDGLGRRKANGNWRSFKQHAAAFFAKFGEKGLTFGLLTPSNSGKAGALWALGVREFLLYFNNL